MTTREIVSPPTTFPAPVLRLAPPPLENGDRLTRREFERRYAAQPRLKKAELIEGEVYMSSPVHLEGHAEPHSQVITWLGVYQAATPSVRLADNATVYLDEDNEVQPDALLRIASTTQRRARVSADDYLDGAPELAVEIAASSATIDLTSKLKVYRRNGVQEYIVWPVYDGILHWFQLREGEYVPLAPDEAGLIHSQVFPGLWLNVKALLAGDLATVLADLQKGLATAEHAAFVERLTTET
jgi:Uma2 family endonuclease